MRRNGRTGHGTRLADTVSRRLAGLARQWRPEPRASAPLVLDDRGAIDSAGRAWSAVLEDPGSRSDPERPSSHDLAADPIRQRPFLSPWSAPALRGLTLLVVLAVGAAGWWWWTGQPRPVVQAPTVLATGQPLAGAVRGEESSPAVSAAPPASDVVVHVSGQVARPGLVELPAGSRVADAVEAAGGVTRRRATDTVNLARVLVDGEQIIVGGPPAAAPGSPVAMGLVNLNTAGTDLLEGLPGVGPVLADRIVQWRAANGPFRSVDELGEVTGIGDSILEQLRPLVQV